MGSIDDLPVELLSRVFHFLYLANRTEPVYISSPGLSEADEVITMEWADKNLRSPSLFPYAPARTCRLWHDILKITPKYWDRVVFDLREDPARWLDSLGWSKQLPLQVGVFNSSQHLAYRNFKPESHRKEAELELSRVQTLMAALTPHLKRCTSIAFKLVYSTSIPPPSVFLQYQSLLWELILTSRNSFHPLSPLSSIAQPWNVASSLPIRVLRSYRRLSLLSLNASELVSLALVFREQLDNLRMPTTKLIVSNHTFRRNQYNSDHDTFTPDEFFKYIRHMWPPSVSFRNILIETPARLSGEPSDDCEAFKESNFAFENVSKTLISTCFQHLLPRFLPPITKFKFCDIPPCVGGLRSPQLILENIPSTTNLRDILGEWTGTDLIVRSSPCFDDAFLSWLARDRRRARFLESLEIENCDSFTIKGLQKLVRQGAQPVSSNSSCIDTLSVRGDHYSLTAEEFRWFEDIVEDVLFTTSDGTLYQPV